MKPIPIDAEELIAALQDHSDESEHFLDRRTGEIFLRVDEGISEPDEEFEALLESDQERFLYIDPMASHIGWKIMADFCEQCSDGKARTELVQALGKPHPFRQFKNVLLDYPGIREQWFVFEHKTMIDIASKWLEQEGITAELPLRPALDERYGQ